MVDAPRSSIFDDIYFSPENGLAETDHVFLKNNNLPESWSQKERFTIVETGFGTGLNFLAAAALFRRTASPGAVLDYVSFEKFPLSAGEIESALGGWAAAFDGGLEQLVREYPLRVSGWHRMEFGPVRLTLIFDDVNEALPRLVCPGGVDCWFLDGFAPAKNPQMWTDRVFEEMARHSRHGASAATFTAAGVVKRGLAQAGFVVEKRRGYGRKRDMLAARYAGEGCHAVPGHPRRVAILGAGLAGTACARVLMQRGYAPVLFDTAPAIASGASGNARGIFNPRFSAQRSAEADFYMAGFAMMARQQKDVPPCGSLHLMMDEEKTRRLQACHETWGWHAEHMRILDVATASAVAGTKLNHGALYLPESSQASPRDLCARWSAGCETRLSTRADRAMLEEYDAVILANGVSVKDDVPWLPLHTVRGQIITARQNTASAAIRTNLCYGGYLGASQNGEHVIGSTFQRWLDDTDIRDEDTDGILAQVNKAVQGLDLDRASVTGARAALRCAAQDRFPVIGGIPEKPGWYVSTAHGSHGMVSAIAGAHVIADLMERGVWSLPRESVNMLLPQRFLDRAARRGENML